MGRKAGTYGDQVPKFKTSEVLAWLTSQFEYSNKCREVAMAEMREKRRQERAERREERGYRQYPPRRTAKDSDESEADEEDAEVTPEHPGRRSDQHQFRTLARETPGVLFANLVAEYRGQLGQFGHDLDIGCLLYTSDAADE